MKPCRGDNRDCSFTEEICIILSLCFSYTSIREHTALPFKTVVFTIFVPFLLMPLDNLYFWFIDIILDRVINVSFTEGQTTKQSKPYLFLLIICLLIFISSSVYAACTLFTFLDRQLHPTELCYFGQHQELSCPSLHLFLFTLGLVREQMWAKYEGY